MSPDPSAPLARVKATVRYWRNESDRMKQECKRPPCQHAQGIDLVLYDIEEAMVDD